MFPNRPQLVQGRDPGIKALMAVIQGVVNLKKCNMEIYYLQMEFESLNKEGSDSKEKGEQVKDIREHIVESPDSVHFKNYDYLVEKDNEQLDKLLKALREKRQDLMLDDPTNLAKKFMQILDGRRYGFLQSSSRLRGTTMAPHPDSVVIQENIRKVEGFIRALRIKPNKFCIDDACSFDETPQVNDEFKTSLRDKLLTAYLRKQKAEAALKLLKQNLIDSILTRNRINQFGPTLISLLEDMSFRSLQFDELFNYSY